MNEPTLCPTCGNPIPSDAPEGVCPVCALGRGLGFGSPTKMAEDEALFRRAEMETLAAAFPQFELLELLGRGGMGEVYKARQKKLGRLVAIKILPEPFGKSDEYTERFLREARSLALLNHPNIVTIYDFGDADGLCYFVMEYIDGVDLRRMIEAQTLTPTEALRIVPQVCDALQFAHDAGIVHRDIKPANILIDKQGRVKIADFGLAKIVSKEAKNFTLTGVGEVMGTAEYMAPEQRRSSQGVDHRADIYSLGVVFYEMLTGEVPMGKFDPPSKRVHVDVRLDDVVLRTLEREPERRYQKVSEVKTSVEAINGASSTGLVAPTSATVRSHRFPIPFVLLSSAAFAATWTVALALWNLRVWGFWLSSALLFAVLVGIMAISRRWFPIISLNWKKESAKNRAVRCLVVMAHCVIGYYLVLSGALAIQERIHWRFPYQEIEHFEKKSKGEEYKLVRQLSAYEKTIPNIELSMTKFNWTRGLGVFGPSRPNLGLYPKWGIYVLLGFGFLILANAVNAAVGTNLWSFRMDPAWRLTKWPIASIGFAIAAGWCVHEYATLIASLGGGAFPVVREVRVNMPLAEARKRIEQSIQGEGYSPDKNGEWREEWKNFVLGESGEWTMTTVPEGKAIGTVSFVNAWKNSPFDRWHWRRGGLHASAPQIQVLFITSDEPVETKVRVTVYWPNVRPPQPQTDLLASALINAVGS
jgi:tRNA A-37 threonylcarbamoyl transferase component Bud32